MIYELKWVAIMDYYHTVLKKEMTKKRVMRERPAMTREQYLDVIPSWANGIPGAWDLLVARWTGGDASFSAISRKNMANRGSDNTHIQGNCSHHRHKNLELVMGQPLTDVQSFEMGRVRKTPKEGKGPYYGTTEEHLKAYQEEFRQRNGKDRDPILSETDETAVVFSGHGKPHGCYAILDNVIDPTVKLTELRATSTTRESMAIHPGHGLDDPKRKKPIIVIVKSWMHTTPKRKSSRITSTHK